MESVEPPQTSQNTTINKNKHNTNAPERRRGARWTLSESLTRERRLRRVRFSEGDALTQSFAAGTDHPPEHGSQVVTEKFPDTNNEFSTITTAQGTENSTTPTRKRKLDYTGTDTVPSDAQSWGALDTTNITTRSSRRKRCKPPACHLAKATQGTNTVPSVKSARTLQTPRKAKPLFHKTKRIPKLASYPKGKFTP